MHTNGPTRAAITARAIPALVLLSLWLGLVGCATSNPDPPLDRSFEHQWSGDIEVMYDTLPREHKNLFFELPEAEYRSRLVELNERASGLSAPEFEIELRRLLAVVGEPSGGRPNHYGEIKSIELPDLGRTLTYSTKYFHTYKGGDPPALMPDIEVPLSYEAYIEGRDRALEAAVGAR